MNVYFRWTAQISRALCATAALALVSACGGGGGGGGAATSASIQVTPALGGFSAGATVSAFKPDGSLVGEATTDAQGSASINMGSYAGPFILKVVGGTGVTYFDEKTGVDEPFAATDSLLSIVPASSITNGAAYGVTPITHLAAAIAGVDSNSVSLAGDNTAVLAAMNQAVTRTQEILGVGSSDLDILAAPTPVRSSTDRLDPSSKASLYGLLLAEMAANSSDNALNQAKRFFTAGRSAKSNNFSSASITQLDGSLSALKAANTRLAAGGAEFLKSGASLSFSPDTTKSLTTVFATASGSGSSGSSAAAAARTMRIVPGLGQFSAGAQVELLGADDGNALLTAVTTNANGIATFDISSLSTVEPFIVRVTGGSGVTYFDEGAGRTEAFGATDVLLAIVPATSTLSSGASFGVTPLTHMAASLAGVASAATGRITVPPPASISGVTDAAAIRQAYAAEMIQAIARVRWALGYKPGKSVSNIYRLDPLVAPDLVGMASDTVDVASAGGLNGLLLLELAKVNRANSKSAYAFANQLGIAALNIKTEDFSPEILSAFGTSALLAEMRTAVSNMSSALTAGATNNATICMSEVDKGSLAEFLAQAGDSVKVSPTSSELSEMGATVSRAVAAHVRATVFPFEKPTSCAP
jgi:hypothetical protein